MNGIIGDLDSANFFRNFSEAHQRWERTAGNIKQVERRGDVILKERTTMDLPRFSDSD